MAAKSSSDVLDEERQLARTTAIGLGVWLTLTPAAVDPLLLIGDGISSPFA